MRKLIILSVTVFLLLPLVQCGKKTPVANSNENNVIETEESVEVTTEEVAEELPEKTNENASEPDLEEATEEVTEETEGESEDDYGSHGALEKEEFTIEEMIVYAMQDELFARGEYEYIINELGAGKPFTNIIKSERNHINMLRPYVTKYNIDIDMDAWKEEIVYPTSIKEALDTCIDAEIYNIDMYEKFLAQELPDDLRTTFEKLKKGSENHLESFRKSRSKY